MLSRSLLVVLLLAAGCLFPSEDAIKDEFDDFVAKNNQCSVAADCALVGAGCPLGCSVSVRADRRAAVEAKARELIRKYERGGRSCDYDCVPQAAPVCQGGRCAFSNEAQQVPDAGG